MKIILQTDTCQSYKILQITTNDSIFSFYKQQLYTKISFNLIYTNMTIPNL